MRRDLLMAALWVAAAGVACTDSGRLPTQPDSITLPLQVSSALDAEAPKHHHAHLKGKEEVFVPATPDAPTPADSHAQGEAQIQISKDRQSFDYKLTTSKIENVVQAHIHCGPAGMNGPIIVWLYPSPTATAPLIGPTGTHHGRLAEDTVEAANVRPVPSSPACPGGVASFEDVLDKLAAENAYVNVHTNDGVPPTNTGPGDFPGGEIRGQVQ